MRRPRRSPADGPPPGRAAPRPAASFSSRWSLHGRLASAAVAVCSATLLVGGAAMYRADRIADTHLLDARLVDLAHTVLLFAEHEIEEVLAEGRHQAVQDADHRFATRYHYQIWSLGGHLLLRSQYAPPALPIRPIGWRGFGEATVNGEHVRTYTEAASKGDMVIVLAERMHDRKAAAGEVTRNFLAFLLLPLLLTILCTWWFLNRVLRSVGGYALQLRAHDPLDPRELQPASVPRELQPVVDVINTLFGRFREALSMERESVALAAHEMRTPLAGLRAQVQLAAELGGTPQELSVSLQHLLSSIDQASHLLDQLLDLARIDSLAVTGARAHDVQRVDLHALHRKIMQDLGPAVAERNIVLKTCFQVSHLPAAELCLQLMMHNLLVNAIRHTPQGGHIEVGSTGQRQSILLTIDDSGPGIPPDRHAEALQRFNRLGRADKDGVGLGLFIVQAVAQTHCATVHLGESPLGGLRVAVWFPDEAA